ncbi:MAG: BCCT family transporter [Alphaproteobacteria bacterium]
MKKKSLHNKRPKKQWQKSGKVDLIGIIQNSGAVAGLWGLLKVLPLGFIFIPVVIITLIISFSTAADAVIETISGLCMKTKKGEEQLEVKPPNSLKVVWGILIGGLAFLMVAKAGGTQGVDGVKYLAAAGGFTILFVFLLQAISLIKVLFFTKQE